MLASSIKSRTVPSQSLTGKLQALLAFPALLPVDGNSYECQMNEKAHKAYTLDRIFQREVTECLYVLCVCVGEFHILRGG